MSSCIFGLAGGRHRDCRWRHGDYGGRCHGWTRRDMLRPRPRPHPLESEFDIQGPSGKSHPRQKCKLTRHHRQGTRSSPLFLYSPGKGDLIRPTFIGRIGWTLTLPSARRWTSWPSPLSRLPMSWPIARATSPAGHRRDLKSWRCVCASCPLLQDGSFSFNPPAMQVVAKLESADSIPNIASIVKEADCVMIARGDLGTPEGGGSTGHAGKGVIFPSQLY